MLLCFVVVWYLWTVACLLFLWPRIEVVGAIYFWLGMMIILIHNSLLQSIWQNKARKWHQFKIMFKVLFEKRLYLCPWYIFYNLSAYLESLVLKMFRLDRFSWVMDSPQWVLSCSMWIKTKKCVSYLKYLAVALELIEQFKKSNSYEVEEQSNSHKVVQTLVRFWINDLSVMNVFKILQTIDLHGRHTEMLTSLLVIPFGMKFQ